MTLALLCLCTVSPPALAAGESSADVYRLVSAVGQEIEHLRWAMGRPVVEREEPQVENVSPHEVYFQAMTLFEKVNRLNFELTLHSRPLPTPPEGLILPENVYMLINDVREMVNSIESHLSFPFSTNIPDVDSTRTPTDVFQLVVHINRQVNLMLDQKFSPSDVFRQVTVAVDYADSILGTLENKAPPPPPTDVPLGKRPVDVYKRLIKAYSLIFEISQKRGLSMLKLRSWTKRSDTIVPSDVYDIASLLVSELDFLHGHTMGARSPRKIHWVRGKFPSDVYHRAGVLENLLKEILVKME
ncbi:hypothetical protein [Pseudodesulfovibrio piezophilus]|uniref:Uncharacterized protein n=1 Tax=Pseudodesulfovibrio piezophilus (strain DSM 21447 / JCM 15486 / C1TLV30) TaxID=1322246 RepID=M1WK50_PSEP2|nr:hypothetical protein [Pseudodesulfovibrio piezophilus]CCH48986.1 exported protein of unknown function [Pseudodesulfovibrio piezophilus C1TLV30]